MDVTFSAKFAALALGPDDGPDIENADAMIAEFQRRTKVRQMIFGRPLFETQEEYEAGFVELQKLVASPPADNTPEWLQAQLLSMACETYELNMTLDLIREADMRGTKMWQDEEPGRELTHPDRGKMIFWLLKQLGKVPSATPDEAESKCLEAIARFVLGLSVDDAPDDCMKMHNAALAMVVMQIRDPQENGDLRVAINEYATTRAQLAKK